ncbi:hypothetical protein D3C84_887230 [compost metagenome]
MESESGGEDALRDLIWDFFTVGYFVAAKIDEDSEMDSYPLPDTVGFIKDVLMLANHRSKNSNFDFARGVTPSRVRL